MTVEEAYKVVREALEAQGIEEEMCRKKEFWEAIRKGLEAGMDRTVVKTAPIIEAYEHSRAEMGREK